MSQQCKGTAISTGKRCGSQALVGSKYCHLHGERDSTRQCRAKAKSTGKRCGRPAIVGGKTCYIHGSGTKKAKQSARERLAALADPAIGTLATVMEKAAKLGDMNAAVRAAIAILDRAGYSPRASQLNLDLQLLSDDQLRRIGEGDDPLEVLTSGLKDTGTHGKMHLVDDPDDDD